LLNERQNRDAPTIWFFMIAAWSMRLWQVVVLRMVAGDRQPKLLEVSGITYSIGCVSNLLNTNGCDATKKADDAEHHQQFDSCEAS